jgi:AcrR family transcriptional regulator
MRNLYAVGPPWSTHAKVDAMDNDSGTGLPASIEAAWGLRERPTKGPKPGLSLERIVNAGVAIASAEGLAAVSMNRIARELGAAPMSLYRYVSAKDELLALMEDAAHGPPPELGPDKGWRAGLADWAQAIHDAWRRNPWALSIPVTTPPITPNQVAWMERGLHCLRGTGLTEGEKISTIILLSGYVRGESTVMSAVTGAFLASGSPTPDEWMASYARDLAKLTDPQRFPALHAVLATGVMDRADGPDDEFAFGLERILDGIAALVG